MVEKNKIVIYPEVDGSNKSGMCLVDFIGRTIWGFLLGLVLAITGYILGFALAWVYEPKGLGEESFGYFGWMHIMGMVSGAISFFFGLGMAFTSSSKDFRAVFRLLGLVFLGLHVLSVVHVWWRVLAQR